MTVAQFHEKLEEICKGVKVTFEVPTLIKSVLGDISIAKKEVKEIAQYELDFFNLLVRKNQVKSSFVYTDENGLPFNEPDIYKFNERQFEYLKTRALTTQLDFFKIHYNHILWLSPKKNIENAKIAISNYPSLISKYLELELQEPGKSNWRLLISALENYILLSYSLKQSDSEAKDLFLKTFHNYNIKSKGAGGVLKNLSEFMLTEKNIFKKGDFNDVSKKLDSLRKIITLEDLHFTSEIIDIIIKIESKLLNDISIWHELQGEIWEELTNQRRGDSFISTDFCRTAIGFYMKSGNSKKVSELKKLYGKLRKELSLDHIKKDIDVTDLNKEIEKYADLVKKLDSTEIIKLLMHGNEFIPSREKLMKTVREDQSFLFKVSSSVVDERGHTSRHYQTEDEKDFEQLLFSFNIELQLWFFPLIREMISKAFISGKLGYPNVLSYLKSESWLGQEFQFNIQNDSKLKGRWLTQIAPSIVEFFVALDHFYFSQKSISNLIPAIDSVTVKIEGIIRTLAEYSNIDTFIIKNDKSGRSISEEKDLNKLLTDPEITNLLGKNDTLFLRFLFTEKSGFNLRNKVAHSLMTFEDYSIGTFMLIFLALLKLGKFRLNPL